jgi:putative exporter of polyketide antibiotics
MTRAANQPAAPEPEVRRPVEIVRWLPYWAVFQADVGQTMRSWVYRTWLLVTVIAAAGYLLYRYAPYQELGFVTTASTYLSDLLRWTVVVSAGLVVMMTAGTISGERGTMADSVLSRGISRHQYFLGKWHARLAVVLGTYLLTWGVALICATLMLHEDLSIGGCAAALTMVTALLATVITCGVTASTLLNSTVLAISVLWMVMYGGGFALSQLPSRFPAPLRMMANLPYVLRGEYDPDSVANLIGWSICISAAAAVVGLVHFARRDV